MLDDDDGVALVAQAVQDRQQLFDVLEVQAGGRLVEDVERVPRIALGQLAGQLHALRLAPRERRRALAEVDVGETHVHQGLQLAGEDRHGVEELAGLLHGHLEHLVDVPALVADIERLAVVPLALADVAGDVDVGQEVHLHLDDPVPLAGLAAAALDVEAEASRPVAARPRLVRLCEQLPDRRKEPRVRCRVRPGRSADGALVDVHHLVEVLEPLDLPEGLRNHRGGVVQAACRDGVERVVDQRRFAGSGHAGDAGEQSGRYVQRHLAEVVAGRLDQSHDPVGIEVLAPSGYRDAALAG